MKNSGQNLGCKKIRRGFYGLTGRAHSKRDGSSPPTSSLSITPRPRFSVHRRHPVAWNLPRKAVVPWLRSTLATPAVASRSSADALSVHPRSQYLLGFANLRIFEFAVHFPSIYLGYLIYFLHQRSTQLAVERTKSPGSCSLRFSFSQVMIPSMF